MAEREPKPKPTYEQLAAENAALRARVATAETKLAARDVERDAAEARARRPKPRALDPKSTSAFGRPYDGR